MATVETGIIRSIVKELMTIDNSQIFDLKDIANIQFECGKCHARYVALLSDWKKLPLVCVNCGEQLVQNQSLEHDALRQFQGAIQRLIETSNTNLIIRFEVTTPKS
jgi:hypothetical protein